jgi:2-polyprenylphenol 6-hydroxylase
MTKIDADIAVVGAGAVGMAAAIACAKLGKKVLLIASKKPNTKMKKAWDERVYALTASTEAWLEELGVWQAVDTSRVNDISAMFLWDSQAWNLETEPLKLQDSDANLPRLGVIIENQNLMQALSQQTLSQNTGALGVTMITDATCVALENADNHACLTLDNGRKINAKLIVAADGVDSWLRQQANIAVKHKDFHQTAIVANFSTTKNHQNIARQWFAPHETLALLPLVGQNVSLVWSVSTEKSVELLELSNEALAEKLQAYSNDELGDLKLLSKVLSFALHQQTATQLVADRLLLVGDAAHQIHPMAGQGMNLGLRDVRNLQELLTNAHAMQDIGETTFLRKYARERQADIASMNILTSGLDTLFAVENNMVKNITGWGFKQLNRQATVKKLLIQQAA